jgi:hypothetical protein
MEKSVLLMRQDFKCAICGGDFIFAKSVAIDHNHQTGTIRGALCNRCNVGLGYFKDDVELLQKAIDYLNNPPNFASG